MGTLKKYTGLGKPPAPPQINVPAPTAEETQLVNLQTQLLQRQIAGIPAQEEFEARQQGYFDQMVSEGQLSPEEEAAFNEEYGLRSEALKEQFGLESEKYGASQVADLTSSGMLETTTGRNIISGTQERFANVLSGQIAELGQSKELAKSDVEAAKREMAMQGYKLTSGLLQSQISSALNTSTNLQNYYGSRGEMEAQVQLQHTLAEQAREQAGHRQRMNLWGNLTNMGFGMMKSGASG